MSNKQTFHRIPPDELHISTLLPLTDRQEAFLEVLNGLKSEYRYTLELICDGSDPVKVESITEHRDINLKP